MGDAGGAWARAASCLAISVFAMMSASRVFAADDAERMAAPALPTTYIDLRTNYATLPANSFSVGLGNSSLFSTLSNLRSLINAANPAATPGLPTLLTLSSPASQSAWIDVPLTVDLSDRISLY